MHRLLRDRSATTDKIEGKDNQDGCLVRRQDSAHEDNCSTVSWKMEVPCRVQKVGRACRDSASSFDRYTSLPSKSPPLSPSVSTDKCCVSRYLSCCRTSSTRSIGLERDFPFMMQ
jgi:hypothetical protein